METIINDFFTLANNYLWGVPMVIILFGTHIFLTIRLKFPQRKLLLAIRLSLIPNKGAKGDVSPIGALCSSLAATIGTGNIIGVATAVSLGGPGAVFWCWLTGVLGFATKYSEGVLAIKYRRKGADGEMLGGPMCALESGLGMKWLAIAFAIFTALATFGIGNTVQANTITTILDDTMGVSPYISGAVITLLLALVICFGIKGIARFSMFLIPFMAVLYIFGCLYILILNSAYLGETISLIVSSAFKAEAIGGGAIGGGFMLAARYGIARGLFSNEAGLGSAPIVAASAKTNDPVSQALVSGSGTFWDTVIICALTGLVVVSSLIANPDLNTTNGALLTKEAFAQIPFIGTPILTVGIITFGFSTMVAWYIYGEKSVLYLTNRPSSIIIYRIINIVVCYIGSIAQLKVVWNAADTMNALMAIPNIVALLLLHKVIANETDKYLWSGKLENKMRR
ncbi:MAG: alanine/glycine:cation symporter family protein [Rikenellaceae bacterium]